MNVRARRLIQEVYGDEEAESAVDRIDRLISSRFSHLESPTPLGVPAGRLPLDERDGFLITYGDQFREHGAAPLETLTSFAVRYLKGKVSGIHILPFFPFTSDDGFSITDYSAVNPKLGNWSQVEALSVSFRLMSDLVLNHCSVSHRWFQGFLDDEAPYRDYFITVPNGTDLSMVARPRALPLLTEFETKAGVKEVWTTFSADQVDLNYANPEVLIEMIGVFFEHIMHGIQVVRLDAIAYLWKEIGHRCIHHPKTHAIVKLFRSLAGEFAPWVVIITETNVPHAENISYFGDGTDEAHMIYQFSLPPLVLDAFLRGDANHLRSWVSSLPPLSGETTYFNFLASHDGVGLLPAQGILSAEELEGLVESAKARGGLISYKATATGEIPYEMNINYCDAVAERSLEVVERSRKFLASQSFLLSFVGVPGIYVHSLLGSGNYREGVEATGRNRTINREKLEFADVSRELDREGSFRNLVYRGYTEMLLARRRPAFHPLGKQTLLPTSGALFAVLRESPDGSDRVVCAVNVSGAIVELTLDSGTLRPCDGDGAELYDIIADRPVEVASREDGGSVTVRMEPWKVLWMVVLEKRD